MNNFVTIESVEEFKNVKFYSIKVSTLFGEEPEYTEFDKFLLKFRDTEDKRIREEFDNIIAIIEHIGDNSADIRYFRFENSAFALPPNRTSVVGIVDIHVHSNLRLYCVVINESNVILCNGGLKTTIQAQNCPNVSNYFDFANKLASYIGKNRKEFDIGYKSLLTGEENGFYL